MSLIKCIDLSLSYEDRLVLKGLNFSVEREDYLCIIGENGSGKSTLVKALLSLKKPDAGKIVFGDGLNENEIGYLPQHTGVQRDFPASVNEVVLSGCLNSKKFSPFYSADDRKNAAQAMEKLGISGLAKRSFRDLSGGQRQRVLLARALCSAKKLILLDEPVNGLDPTVTRDMYSMMKKLNADGMTVIMVSHDIRSALKYATHILHLNRGSSFFGTLDEYVKSETGKEFLD